MIYNNMMSNVKKIFFASLLALGSFAVNAKEPDLKLLKENLYTGAEIKSVKPTVIKGLYEVLIDRDFIVYVSEDGKISLTGDLFDLEKGFSYTDKTKSVLRNKELQKVKDSDKIIYKAKDEKYKIMVFTDVSCYYCRKFHSSVTELNDNGITVEYLAFPRAGLGSKTQKLMQKIWCAEDKTASLTKAKLSNEYPQKPCKGNQVAEQFVLGQDIGIAATPTVILPDGKILEGYYKADELLKILKQ